MDRSQGRDAVGRPAIHGRRRASLELLLSAGGGQRSQPASDAADRRAVHPDPVLRGAEDDPLAAATGGRRQPQARGALDAADGTGGDLPGTQHLQGRSRTPGLPEFAEGADHRSPEPGVVDRHHLHPLGWRLAVSGGDHGLVFALCPCLGAVGDDRRRILPVNTGVGACRRATRDLGAPIKGRSSPALRSPTACWPPASRSAWTVADERWTTCSPSASGAPSSTRRCTSRTTARPPTPGLAWIDTSGSTTPTAHTRPWTTARRPRFTSPSAFPKPMLCSLRCGRRQGSPLRPDRYAARRERRAPRP